jgi:hypothetical protein
MNEESQAGCAPEDGYPERPDGRPDVREMLKVIIRDELDSRMGPKGVAEKPLPAEPIALDEQVHAPAATEALLNAQLLECVAMVRDAGYLYRNTLAPPDDRGAFILQTGKLMEMSARLADAINRLRGAPEPVKTTRHVVAVEHVGGGGTAKPENE